MAHLLKFILIVLIIATSLGCTKQFTATPNHQVPVDSVLVKQGHHYYRERCIGCHGLEGMGGTAKSIQGIHTNQIIRAIGNEQLIVDHLALRGETSLDSRQQLSIAAYLQSFKPEKSSEPAEPIKKPTNPFANLARLEGVLLAPTPVNASIMLVDSDGRQWVFQAASTGKFNLPNTHMRAPLLLKANIAGEKYEYYSYAITEQAITLSPLTDLTVRHAIANLGTTPETLIENCTQKKSRCLIPLISNNLELADNTQARDFMTSFDRFQINISSMNAKVSDLQAMGSNILALINNLETHRIKNCTNPINPHGYHYDDDSDRDCFHDGDTDKDGFVDTMN